MRVFISSPSSDLEAYRKAAIAAISRLGHQPAAMEYFTAADANAVMKCLQEVAKSDVYVGILARRYGFIPTGYDMSITELEYQAAEQAGIPVLIFLLADDVEWPAEYTDSDSNAERLHTFREHLKQHKVVDFFGSADDLAARITAAVANVAHEHRDEAAARDFLAGPFSGTVGQFFKDREQELHQLQQHVSNQHLRLLLVCGRGGVGKTALISRLLHGIQSESRHRTEAGAEPLDSIVFVALGQSDYRSPDKAVELLCRTLPPMATHALTEEWKQDKTLDAKLEFLFQHTLKSWRCLIVLDNFEDVLDDNNRILAKYADLEQFVAKCAEYDHRAKVLLTSRKTLVFSPELEARIAPRRVELPLDQGLPADAAEALLRDLDTDATLGIKDADAGTLHTVASQCYGIPRTLETLVGTLRQKRTWTLKRLLDTPDDLARLTDYPARELYESLSPDERQVVQAIAVYARPVPTDAVSHLLPDLPVDNLLDSLVRNYVVKYGNEQFSLHSFDQHYAYAQISDEVPRSGKAVFHESAAEYFHQLRKDAAQWKGITDLDPHLQEFHHLTRAGLHDTACALLNEIDREYLAVWGHYALIIELRTMLLGHIHDRALEGLNLGNLACAFLESGETEKAATHYKVALAIAREVGNKADEGRWLGNLGVAFNGLNMSEQSKQHLEQALEIARAIGDRCHHGRWLGKLADLELAAGRVQEAIDIYEEAVAITREVHDQRFEEYWLAQLGKAYLQQNKVREAVAYFEDSIEIADSIGDRAHQHTYLLNLGACFDAVEDWDNEARCYEKAIELARQIGDRVSEGNDLVKLGESYAVQGSMEKTKTCYEQAITIANELGDRVAEGAFLRAIAEHVMSIGQVEKAIAYYERALNIVRDVDDRISELKLLNSLGTTSYYLGDTKLAISYYKQALLVAQRLDDQTEQSILLFNIGDAYHLQGELAKAERYYKDSLAYDQPITNYKCMAGLGMIYLQQGRLDDARGSFNQSAMLCEQRLKQNPCFHPEYAALALAQIGMGESEQGLATLKEGLENGHATAAGLHYAHQDILVQQRCREDLPGLNEAISLIENAIGDESVLKQ